ncbi:C-type lectin-related protein 1 precursor [Biomphalaria pfeifferi]|uniref:C-type lectin-related protein 1 n=1 Tax=Biomphalaria pfeifferi TaxID=112525 RepID=A0AAD8C2B0_BIOPF|nr:C-type lectin-related protein 1 precursor [Biomphalaria pfeifferi]
MKLLLRFVICAFIAKFSKSELLIDVQPDVISPELTSQLLVNCSVSDDLVPGFNAINSLSLSSYNETNKKFDVLLLLDTQKLSLQQLFQFQNAQISFGNLYVALLLYNPTESDARVYRCNVKGDTSFGKNISIVAKKTVELRGNVTALVEEIRCLKKNYENDLCSLKRDGNGLCSLKRDGNGLCSLKRDGNGLCSLKRDDLNGKNNQKSNGVIAMISGDQPIVRTGPDIISPSIKGELYHNISKVSFLQITWRKPTVLESGKYFCGAHVKISEKKIDRLNRMLTTTVERPTIDDLFRIVLDFKKLADEQKQSLNDNEQKLKKMEEDLISNQQNMSTFREETKKLVAELSNSHIEWKGKIDKALDNQVLFNSNTKVSLWQTHQQDAHISELQTENGTMKQLQNISNFTLSALTNRIFIETAQYNGTVYLLSNVGLTDNIRYAQTICEVVGGYLVEVNTDAEFTFLRNFLQTITPPLVFIYTGGTDEGHEGVWINRYSQTSMKTFWAPKEPTSSVNQNCQTFWKKYDWYMDDLECNYKTVSESGFMCEISE